MIINLPGDRQFEAYWLANTPWRHRPVQKADGGFLWIYWGRFAFGFSPRTRRRRSYVREGGAASSKGLQHS